MTKKFTWKSGPYRWGQEYAHELEAYEVEEMNAKKKEEPVKLKDDPLLMPEDMYALGFVLIILFGLIIAVATQKPAEPMGPEDIKVVEELEPNAEAKPYGSTTGKDKSKTRDIFLENFSR